MTTRPNHALQRTRPSRHCCNPCVPWAGSLSLGRWAAFAFMVLQSPILALGQGLEIFPFLGSICVSAVAGFLLGYKKQRWLIMWCVCAGFAGFGVLMVGPMGLLSGFPMPLLYYYGRYS